MDGDRNPYLNPHFRRQLQAPSAPLLESERKTINMRGVPGIVDLIAARSGFNQFTFFNSHDPFARDEALRYYQQNMPREYWDMEYVEERARERAEWERQQRNKKKK